MKIAITGCAHGELDKIYAAVGELERLHDFRVGLLLNCGDFQAARNPADLQALAVSQKYRRLNAFYKYYSGERQAPYLTIFIGGNHEASNYLAELPYGGWVAPNIYYMGMAGCLRFGKLRIAGISGIHKQYDYMKGHFETPPYDSNTLRSVFHFRSLEVFRLKQLGDDLDIFMSHDWPVGIYHHGDLQALLRAKRFFQQDIQNNCLGAQPLADLLDKLMPKNWFAAHLHCKFAALYSQPDDKTTTESTPEEKKRVTKFLALDKCLPRRGFLQILDFDTGLEGESFSNPEDFAQKLRYDPAWLAILKSTDHLLNPTPKIVYMPGPVGVADERYDFRPTNAELEEVDNLLGSDFKVPLNFCLTAPTFNPAENQMNDEQFQNRMNLLINPQTTLFCEKLGIKNLNQILAGQKTEAEGIGQPITISSGSGSTNRSAFFLPPPTHTSDSKADLFQIDTNPDEISLDDEADRNGFEKTAKICTEIQQESALNEKFLDETQEFVVTVESSAEKSDESSTVGHQNADPVVIAPLNAIKFPMKRRNADIYQPSAE